ncbi:MAG: molybdopterin-dependent oxidoreductase [Bryobacteraceae bacterium]
MTRRQLLAQSAAPLLLRPAMAAPVKEAQNLSFPLRSIEGALTPPDLFFVRDHFHEPQISLSSWKLKIEGRVAKPLELGLADIIESPTKKLQAVLECAGNSAGGPAASNGEWEGVPLAHLLQKAEAESGAVALLLEGADSGRLMPGSPNLPYSQLVPITKCTRPESLIAFKLNGKFLLRQNGFPARAMFPGWYAMDSVKWLQRIVVLGRQDAPPGFQESGMHKVYNRIVETAPGHRTSTRLTEILVKSAIAWPADNWNLPAARHQVRGFAWTGSGSIRKVEFSADGGRSWAAAKLPFLPEPFQWVPWSYAWLAQPGEHVLMSRATDSTGKSQPLQREAGRKDGYEFNHCAPVRCSVQ